MSVSSFYDLFPKINYDIAKSRVANYEQVTNIFFRLGIIRNVIDNISSYFVYDIQDGDTPEVVAEKVYGDAGAAWMILLANRVMDAQYEWPLSDNSFNEFLIRKYGSIETALITPHHYEKVITRRNVRTGVENTTRFWVNEGRLTENMPSDIPFSYFEPWTVTTYRTADSGAFTADGEAAILLADLDNGEPFGATLDRGNLALTGEYNEPQTYDVNGEGIEVIIKGEVIYCYNYEKQLNDDRRSIKIIKSEYYTQIMDEFKSLTSNKPTYIRRLV